MSESPHEPGGADLGGAIETLRERFLTDVARLRPQLHRYCARMTGSVLDGEDVVQETLVHAFYRLPTLRDEEAMARWLFRIAHNKCLDFLRLRRPELLTDSGDDEPSYEAIDQTEEQQAVSEALELLLKGLPPKERASVLLKDVLGYSLAEVAEIVDSTVGGVKAALHRGRGKLDGLRDQGAHAHPELTDPELLRAYVDAFNGKQWDSLQGLIRADARLELVGRGDFGLGDGYFGNYLKLPWEWELALGRVDGEPMILHYRREDGRSRPHAGLRVTLVDGRIQAIRDYVHVDYLFAYSHLVERDDAASETKSG